MHWVAALHVMCIFFKFRKVHGHLFAETLLAYGTGFGPKAREEREGGIKSDIEESSDSESETPPVLPQGSSSM